MDAMRNLPETYPVYVYPAPQASPLWRKAITSAANPKTFLTVHSSKLRDRYLKWYTRKNKRCEVENWIHEKSAVDEQQWRDDSSSVYRCSELSNSREFRQPSRRDITGLSDRSSSSYCGSAFGGFSAIASDIGSYSPYCSSAFGGSTVVGSVCESPETGALIHAFPSAEWQHLTPQGTGSSRYSKITTYPRNGYPLYISSPLKSSTIATSPPMSPCQALLVDDWSLHESNLRHSIFELDADQLSTKSRVNSAESRRGSATQTISSSAGQSRPSVDVDEYTGSGTRHVRGRSSMETVQETTSDVTSPPSGVANNEEFIKGDDLFIPRSCAPKTTIKVCKPDGGIATAHSQQNTPDSDVEMTDSTTKAKTAKCERGVIQPRTEDGCRRCISHLSSNPPGTKQDDDSSNDGGCDRCKPSARSESLNRTTKYPVTRGTSNTLPVRDRKTVGDTEPVSPLSVQNHIPGPVSEGFPLRNTKASFSGELCPGPNRVARRNAVVRKRSPASAAMRRTGSGADSCLNCQQDRPATFQDYPWSSGHSVSQFSSSPISASTPNWPSSASVSSHTRSLSTLGSSSFSFGSSEVNYEEGLSGMVESLKSKVLWRVMTELHSMFDPDSQPGNTQAAGESSSSSSSNNGSQCDLRSDDSASTQMRNMKRPAREDNASRDDEEEGEERGSKRPRKEGPNSTDESPAKIFACPYYKVDPQKCPKRACRTGFSSVHRVKEHVYRSHAKPITCSRCFEKFGEEALLHAHNRMDPPCAIVNPEPPAVEGCTKEQERQLRSRRRPPGQTEEDRWVMMYMILFPDSDNIPTPYFESMDTKASDSNDGFSQLEDFMSREVPWLVMQKLKQRLTQASVPMEEILISELPELIRRCQEEKFKSFRGSRTTDPTSPTEGYVVQEPQATFDQFFVPPPAITSPVIQTPLTCSPHAVLTSKTPPEQTATSDSGYGSLVPEERPPSASESQAMFNLPAPTQLPKGISRKEYRRQFLKPLVTSRNGTQVRDSNVSIFANILPVQDMNPFQEAEQMSTDHLNLPDCLGDFNSEGCGLDAPVAHWDSAFEVVPPLPSFGDDDFENEFCENAAPTNVPAKQPIPVNMRPTTNYIAFAPTNFSQSAPSTHSVVQQKHQVVSRENSTIMRDENRIDGSSTEEMEESIIMRAVSYPGDDWTPFFLE